MSTDPKHIVRTRGSTPTPAQSMHVRHPFNPRSDVSVTLLSDTTGMERVGVSLARIPPGKEGYVPHSHSRCEEFVFVIEGQGTALVGEQEVAIGPGDFLGYPTDGTTHHIRNTGSEDLVFLQGGERREGDLGRFPTLGKIGLHFGDETMRFVKEADIEELPFSAWLASPDDPDASRG